ncbi:hypothetical protein H0484_06415 [Pusillimonas sp. CC-YST705]|uniref:Uncharacterized protein n=1 Tax=Mesopusillimonas faecipullorum TaxID=2755040 RepID=A0ABS8CBH4_9BURK|nr:hypothetical protein [Mesopusillimonas faecipullorum]MCB5363382.1 hypothetical protein [Mesopusillimonas faecipullorum]
MSRSYVQQHLTVGKSSQADVRALYGEPEYKSESSRGEDFWSYHEDQINPDYVSKAMSFLPSMGTAGDAVASTQERKTRRSLDFHFDRAGILESFNVSGTTGAGK